MVSIRSPCEFATAVRTMSRRQPDQSVDQQRHSDQQVNAADDSHSGHREVLPFAARIPAELSIHVVLPVRQPMAKANGENAGRTGKGANYQRYNGGDHPTTISGKVRVSGRQSDHGPLSQPSRALGESFRGESSAMTYLGRGSCRAVAPRRRPTLQGCLRGPRSIAAGDGCGEGVKEHAMVSKALLGDPHSIARARDQRAAGRSRSRYRNRRSPGLDLTSEKEHRAAPQVAGNTVHSSCHRAGGRDRRAWRRRALAGHPRRGRCGDGVPPRAPAHRARAAGTRRGLRTGSLNHYSTNIRRRDFGLEGRVVCEML